MKSPELIISPASVKMSPPTPAPKSLKIFFSVFTQNDGVLSERYGAWNHTSLPRFFVDLQPSLCKKSVMGMSRISSIVISTSGQLIISLSPTPYCVWK